MAGREPDGRPSPESLLKLAAAEEEQGKGRLKLFFGMSPGVGKTYAMLEAARRRAAEGADVVVGLVETHGRAETEALLAGLEAVPRRVVHHKGVALGELDLDALLARRPRLAIVDELAHTNAPGSRHRKRWQDVEELLDAGIDVYSTLNVQHWESLNDVVAKVTGRLIRETVPDVFLARVAELELVDLSPEDLLQRLREGKVYQGELAGRAAESFFRTGNLIALRELALRHTAEYVEAQMESFRERHAPGGVRTPGERLLVGVSSGPMSARLIRATARLAGRLKGPWIAAYVETPGELRLPAADRARVVENLRLAERLGAETLTVSGQRISEEVLNLARARDVTTIVLGKPARPRWKEWVAGSVVNELARAAGDIDLYVMSGVGSGSRLRRAAPARREPAWRGAGWGVAVVGAVTLVSWPLAPLVDRANLAMLYLAAVAWTGYRFGRVPSVVAAALGVLAFDFFFVPPGFSFAVADAQYVVTFLVMFGVGLLVSGLTDRLRRQHDQMRRREERLRTLYRLTLEMSETPEPRSLLARAQARLEEFYRAPVLLITPGAGGGLAVAAGDAGVFGFGENERAVAQWVLLNAGVAGAGTDTLGGAAGLYVPLRGLQSTVGVLGVRPADAAAFADPEQMRLLETFAAGIGGALESTRMSEAAGRAEMMLEMKALAAPAPAAALRLGDSLGEERVRLFPPDAEPERIVRDLLATLDVPNPAQALGAILERERAGTTFIGSGVSIPHARLPGLPGIQAALGVSPGGATKIWVLFLGPAEDPERHLAFLAGVAGFFRAPGRVAALLGLETPAEILARIRALEAAAAASRPAR